MTPSGVVVPSACQRITAMPLAARSRPTIWKGWTRSRVIAAASRIVKKDCACTTSEARPGAMKPLMAMNSSPNWPAPIRMP